MRKHRTLPRLLLCLLFPALLAGNSFSQGRVVINEYMPWTPSACGPSAEFIELLNFGPGPMNIGCYFLTDGDYAITIPPNTILQPGEFYVISGMDVIPYPCANIDSTIHTDLNWTTCNCTSATIPVTGDGFLTDGGYANEQLVLLDPLLNVVDAVVRSLPVEPSALITTSMAGGCIPRSFDLDLMTINYETIGESAGRGNSFSRRLDGDCGWVKDPQQSGNATNNTPGDVSDVTYAFQYINSMGCPNNGAVLVTVYAANYSNVFPMTYTLAFDADADGIFESTDTYTTGTVTNPNTIAINNLVPGMYRLTVGSVKGCNLRTFPFIIVNCHNVLAAQLTAFTVSRHSGGLRCSWTLEKTTELSTVTIERSADGIHFMAWNNTAVPATGGSPWYFTQVYPDDLPGQQYFRLKMTSTQGSITYSTVVQLSAETGSLQCWPNPARDILNIQYPSAWPATLTVISSNGICVIRERVPVSRLNQTIQLNLRSLATGMYRLVITADNGEKYYFPFAHI